MHATSTPDRATRSGRRLYALHGEKLRFLVVGAANTAIGYAMFLVALAFARRLVPHVAPFATPLSDWFVAHNYLCAQWVAWVASVPIGAMTLRVFVFRASGPIPAQILRAYFVYLPTLGISTAMLWFAVTILKLTPELGQILAAGIAAIFSYLGHKHVTFRTPAAPE